MSTGSRGGGGSAGRAPPPAHNARSERAAGTPRCGAAGGGPMASGRGPPYIERDPAGAGLRARRERDERGAEMFEGFKVGLALGGGAARGLAHIGVLKVLEENQIPIDLIVGTGVGARVGGVYATTRSVVATEKRFRDFIFSKEFKRSRFDFLKESRQARPGLLYNFVSLVKKGIFYSFSMATTSWISAEHFEHNINSILDDVRIEDTSIPFAAVATDINRGEEGVPREGALRAAGRASSAVPRPLPPVPIDGRPLIDGGLMCQGAVAPAPPPGGRLGIRGGGP